MTVEACVYPGLHCPVCHDLAIPGWECPYCEIDAQDASKMSNAELATLVDRLRAQRPTVLVDILRTPADDPQCGWSDPPGRAQ